MNSTDRVLKDKAYKKLYKSISKMPGLSTKHHSQALGLEQKDISAMVKRMSDYNMIYSNLDRNQNIRRWFICKFDKNSTKGRLIRQRWDRNIKL